MLLDLFFEHATKWNMKLTDGFFGLQVPECCSEVVPTQIRSCSCTGVQHVKKNIRDE